MRHIKRQHQGKNGQGKFSGKDAGQARVGAEETGKKWIHWICILELESLGFTEGRLEVQFEGS